MTRAALLAALLALAACATPATPPDCTFARVITVAPDDHLTAETAREILTFDRQVKAVCR